MWLDRSMRPVRGANLEIRTRLVNGLDAVRPSIKDYGECGGWVVECEGTIPLDPKRLGSGQPTEELKAKQ